MVGQSISSMSPPSGNLDAGSGFTDVESSTILFWLIAIRICEHWYFLIGHWRIMSLFRNLQDGLYHCIQKKNYMWYTWLHRDPTRDFMTLTLQMHLHSACTLLSSDSSQFGCLHAKWLHCHQKNKIIIVKRAWCKLRFKAEEITSLIQS